MKYSAYTFTLESDAELHFPFSEGESDILIKSAEFELPKLKRTKIHRAGTLALYGMAGEYHYLSWPGFVDFKINTTQIFYQKNEKCPSGLFSIFLSSEALGICLFLRDCFLLHGSAVVLNQKAAVFIGTPGAGKSTTVAAYAKEGFTVLSDDMVAIKFDKKNTALVLAAGPEIKIWQDSAENLGFDLSLLEPAWEGKNKYLFQQKEFPTNKAFELNAINIILKPSSKKYNEEIRFIDSPILLLKYFPLAHQLLNQEHIKSHFEKSLLIFEQAKFNYIRRPKNFQKLKEWVKAQK
jgi:hypothetical protein